MTILERDAQSAPAVGGRAIRPGILLAVVLTAQFMAMLDVSVVNVAAQTIRNDLRATGAGLQLVVSGYTISYAVLLITGARLGDRFGHRQVFLTGLAGFTAASLACGLAGSTGELIGFRFVQGAAAALMMPQVLSLIQRTFIGPARARALSGYSAVIAGGAIVGQVAGGALVGANIWGTGWRPAFLVNVPIGVALLILGRALPGDRGEPGRGLDLPGLVTFAVAVLLFVVPLVLGHEERWPLWGWISLAMVVPMLVAFATVERRAGTPLVPGRVLRAPGLLPALGAIFTTMAGYSGYLFSVALHLQAALGFSPLRAGLTFGVGGFVFGVASLNWHRLPARWHRGLVPVGLLAGALGLVLVGLALHDGRTPGALFWASQVFFGLGFGSAFSPMITLALSRVPVADAADASGLLTTTTQLSMVVGVATFGSLYLSLAGGHPSGQALGLTTAGEVVATLASACFATRLLRRR
jgi:MFS family permease